MKYIVLLPVIAICISAVRRDSSDSNVNAKDIPQYNNAGELKRPSDFEGWVFVGSNIGLQYRADVKETTLREKNRRQGTESGDFHNVYINPTTYQHFLKTGKFPNKTVLVMDVYEAKNRDAKNVVSKGLFPGKRRRIEVAVKNNMRPDGSQTDWAYYVFNKGAMAAKAFPDGACYRCHRKHASVDNVWVQFYPILRDAKVGP